MDVPHAYAMLQDACRILDQTGDHAAAAYVGHGMALLEMKYGIGEDRVGNGNIADIRSPARTHDGGNWA